MSVLVVDWGTSRLRAYLMSPEGEVLQQVSSDMGMLPVIDSKRAFGEVLRAEVKWPEVATCDVILCGMVGSRQGWMEAPYVPLPCTFTDLAGKLVPVEDATQYGFGGRVFIAPGVCHMHNGRALLRDVARGEETQLCGLVHSLGGPTQGGIVCLPGTHSKWVRLGRIGNETTIEEFETYMTGEWYNLLRNSSVLSKGMPTDGEATEDTDAAFLEGVEQASKEPLLHSVFTVRALTLSPTDDSPIRRWPQSYLSGLLIGSEVHGAFQSFGRLRQVWVVSTEPKLSRLYNLALHHAGAEVLSADTETPLAAVGGHYLHRLHVSGGPLTTLPTTTASSDFERHFLRMPLVAILRGVTPDAVVAICEALISGGITVIEVPLNSPDAYVSIQRVADGLGAGGRCIVGAGTVLSEDNVDRVRRAGGQFIVSPNTDQRVIRRSKELGMMSVPGCFTPTEAFAALEAGADALKLFPAEGSSPAFVKALRAVLPAGTRVVPTGGVHNMAPWIQAGASGFGLGSTLYRPGVAPEDVQQRAVALCAAYKAVVS